MNASWTVELPEGLTLDGFEYTVLFSEDEESTGQLAPTVTSVAIPGFGEILTFVVAAQYRVGDSTDILTSPSASASCGLPNAPTNVNVNCAPGDDTASNATASWLPPVERSGIDLRPL